MNFAPNLAFTETEYRELYAKAGFRLERIVPTPTEVSVIEGKPV